jgi:hypothetical protein
VRVREIRQPFSVTQTRGSDHVIDLLSKTSEQLRKLKVESIVDDRVVKKLEKEWLF